MKVRIVRKRRIAVFMTLVLLLCITGGQWNGGGRWAKAQTTTVTTCIGTQVDIVVPDEIGSLLSCNTLTIGNGDSAFLRFEITIRPLDATGGDWLWEIPYTVYDASGNVLENGTWDGRSSEDTEGYKRWFNVGGGIGFGGNGYYSGDVARIVFSAVPLPTSWWYTPATETLAPTPVATPTPTPTVVPWWFATSTPVPTPVVPDYVWWATSTPSSVATPIPTPTPTVIPWWLVTPDPTVVPTPTQIPTITPTAAPTVTPTAAPAETPTVTPTAAPTATPMVTPVPTAAPTPTDAARPVETPAQAAKQTWTVTYDSNGGLWYQRIVFGALVTDNLLSRFNKGDASVTQTKEQDVSLELSPGPGYIVKKTGYIFLGWATSRDAVKAEFEAGDFYTENKSVTLYAVWKLKEYTVVYDLSGGEGNIPSQTKYYGIDMTLSDLVPVKKGYLFLGWAGYEGAKEAAWSAGDVYTLDAYTSSADYADFSPAEKILYAVWEKHTVKQNLKTAVKLSKTLGGAKSFRITPAGIIKSALVFKSSDKKVATVVSHGSYGVITLKKPGVTKITITAPAVAGYESARKVVTLKVGLAKPKIKVTFKNEQMKIAWGKVKGAKKYKLLVKRIGAIGEHSYDLKGNETSMSNTYTKGKTYVIKVRAIDSSGKYKSAWSKKTIKA